MLQITNLHAEVDGKPILKGLSLAINAGEIHAIMGPNGAGKSTLGYVLSGRPGYEVTDGSVSFLGEDLLDKEPHERAAAGLFLGFQYPVEIPGVSNVQFLRTALNAQRRLRGQAELSGGEFLKVARAQADALGLDMEMLKRPVNVGFSGGEKKRNEMVQMGIIDPKLAILDETDSGLDIDALRTVGDGINRIMRTPDKAVLLITHYQRLLDYVRPDFVHVLADGRIVRSGGPELAHELEREGYAGTVAAWTLALPSKRDEAWRWADLSALPALAEAQPAGGVIDASGLWLNLGGPRLLFVNGRLDPDLSELGPIAPGQIEAATAHPLGRLATGDGWTLALGRDHAAAGPIEVVHVTTGGTNHVPARIDLAEDAQASVVETFVGDGWANRLTTITLGHGARLMRAVRLRHGSGFVSLRDETVLGEGASLVATMLGAGGAGTRIDAAVTLAAPGGYAEYGGALLARGEQRQEAAVVVRHAAIEGASRQLWRAVADDEAAASLAARVEVARGAQKTDGEQSLRGLLLRRTATVNLKPELEIFADDVKCAHGATVGELDRRALFYLASRGVPPAQARALLTRAFVADALDRIGEEAVRTAFVADADAWLGAIR